MPTREDLDHYYSSNYEAYDEKHGAEADDDLVIQIAKKNGTFRHIPLPEGKRVLDFGSGGGYFLNICRKLGAEVQGIELSQFGVDLTRKQGISVFQGTVEDFVQKHGDNRYDIIASNHVIEHVHDPVSTLSALRSLLAEDGIMVITVPNARSASALRLGKEWHSTDLPYHIQQFSAASMRRGAERAGLSIRSIGTTSLTSATTSSLRLYLRHKFLIPRKLTNLLPLDWIGARIARHDDQRAQGEALLVCLTSERSR